jgi:ABC-2 type transport system permease protein
MSTYTGTWPLVRLMLRRDRVRLPIWVLAILGVVYSSAEAVQGLYGTQEKLDVYAQTMTNSPAVIVMSGPPTALHTLGGVTVYEINSTVLVAVALMAIFLVVRHTRAEEEAGRTELMRSTVVGRHAPTTAALIVVGGATVLVAAGITAILLGLGLPATGSLAYGSSIAAFGLAFTAIGAGAAQATAHARGAVGMAAALLGVAYALRAVGDVGTPALSWVSPMGWVQAVRPYGDERWWPILLLLAFAAGMFTLAAVLTAHRDVGAGLLAARAGPGSASPRLGTSTGLAARLQRGSLIGWTVGMFIGGIAFGSLSNEVSAMADLNQDFADALAAMSGGLVDAFRATMLLILALVAAGFTVSSVQRMRSEETSGRVEPLLATGMSRTRWLAGSLSVTLVGTLLVTGAGGLGMGLADAVVQGEAAQAPRLLVASLAYAPAAFMLAGLGVLLIGWAPRAVAAVWGLLAFCVVVGWLGTVLAFPQWVTDISPYSHISQVPAEPMAWGPLLALVVFTVASVTVGATKLVKRDIA